LLGWLAVMFSCWNQLCELTVIETKLEHLNEDKIEKELFRHFVKI